MGRSLVSYAGGKGMQLERLLPLIPYTQMYVEPYGGGASVLLNRRPSHVEVYNDLDGRIVNLFTVCQDPIYFTEFERRISLTLFSKEEFVHALALQNDDDPVLAAWGTFVVLNQGISGKQHTSPGNWSRSRQSNVNTSRWLSKINGLLGIHERLANVQIDNQDALDCIDYWDDHATTFYLDPPYVLETRGNRSYYSVEQPLEHHERLVEALLGVQGAVVLSGYDHPVYEPLTASGWACDTYGVTAVMKVGDGEKPRRAEMVWRNPRCLECGVQAPLF